MAYDDFSCRDIVELVTDYLEGALTPEVHAAVERHLIACDGCAAYLDQMREVIRLTGALRNDEVPPVVMEALAAAFRSLDR